MTTATSIKCGQFCLEEVIDKPEYAARVFAQLLHKLPAASKQGPSNITLRLLDPNSYSPDGVICQFIIEL